MQRCFGGSRAGRILPLIVLAAISALVFGVPTASAAGPLPIQLGYGPSTMTPVSQGIPVYTTGDTIWVLSNFTQQAGVTLTSPTGGPRAGQTVQPRAIVPLYTFLPGDGDGQWRLTVSSGGRSIIIPVTYVNPGNHKQGVDTIQYGLLGGALSIEGHIAPGDSYDQQVCVASNNAQGAFVIPLPLQIAEGQLSLAVSGGKVLITPTGVNQTSFSFWFELYHPYSFNVANSTTFLLRNLRAAAAEPLTLDSSNIVNTTLDWASSPRHGRFELRAFFQNTNGLTVMERSVLIGENGEWVSLDACQTQPVESQFFSYETALGTDPASWPAKVYVMYRVSGVEMVSSFPVAANISVVKFVPHPWATSLQGINVHVAPNEGINQTSVQGDTVYIMASRYPVTFGFSADIAGIQATSGSLQVRAANTITESLVNLAKLTVRLTSSDNSSQATVTVASGRSGANLTGIVTPLSNASFYLPEGTYTVTASQGGRSQSAQAALNDGLETVVSFDITTPQTLEIILVVTGAIGVAANILLWLRRSSTRILRPANLT